MIKKTITYTDYNNVERTEDFYFNLTKAEIMEMEMSVEGGFAERLQKIVDSKSAPAIIQTFKELVLKAYGEKSDDGKRFMKSPEIADAFSQNPAYSEIFMELAMDADAAQKFINGIVPSDMAAEAAKQASSQGLAPAN